MTTGAAAAQLDAFIGKFAPADQERIRAVRAVARSWFPTGNELVWDNYNFLVIGYSPTDRPSDSVLSIAARANAVAISFLHGATLPDPLGLLNGDGKQNRFLRIPALDVLSHPGVLALVAAAVAQNPVSFAPSGGGALIIRSVSEKQQPRRKPVR